MNSQPAEDRFGVQELQVESELPCLQVPVFVQRDGDVAGSHLVIFRVGSKVHSYPRLEDEHPAIFRAVRHPAAAGSEHPADVRLEIPVQLPHQQVHAAAMHVAAGQVRVGYAGGDLERATGAVFAKVEIVTRDESFESPGGGVVAATFAG